MNKGIRTAIKFISAYLITVLTGVLTGYGITRIDILLPLLFLAVYIILDEADSRLIRKEPEKSLLRRAAVRECGLKGILSKLKYKLPLAALFSLSVITGRHIDVWNDMITSAEPVDAVLFILLTALMVLLLTFLYRLLDDSTADGYDVQTAGEVGGLKADRLSVPAWMGIFILCRLPYYLTLFPGNLGKDTFESVDMVLGNIPWTNHHPIFFTSVIAAVLSLTGFADSITVSLGVLTFLHMTATEYVLARITVWLLRRDGGRYRKAGAAAGIFYALHPVISMYSMYITKDVLFSCALALLVLRLADYPDTDGIKDGRYYLWLSVDILFVMLLRNNGIYIAAALTLLLCISRKRDIKRLIPALLIPIAVFCLYRGISYRLLNIQPESFAESASIPIQQIGYVIREHTDDELGDVLTEEELTVLNAVIPSDRVREIYDLGYTDTIKFDEAFDDEYFNDHKREYMRIWGRLLPRYFGDYVLSYLAQTAGYWHYGETNTVATQGVWEDNTIGVTRVDVIERMTGASLYGIIEKLMLGMRKAPLLCILSSMAMQFYTVLLVLCLGAVRGHRGRYAIALSPLILLWLSIMAATPAFCLFRYMYAFFILWPVFIYMILYKDE